MIFFIIFITFSILIACPKITFCNIVLLFITTVVVYLSGFTGGPKFFLWVYAFFAMVTFYDGFLKNKKVAEARQNEIDQALLYQALQQNKKKRNR